MSIDTMNYAKVNYLELDATYSEGICIGKDNKVYVCNSAILMTPKLVKEQLFPYCHLPLTMKLKLPFLKILS